MGFSARFDLRYRAAGFDFFTWMLYVQAKFGADEIVFGTGMPEGSAWSREEILGRYKSILEPGPALAGLPYRVGDDGEDIGTHKIVRTHELASVGVDNIKRMRSVLPPRNHRFTVTLRKATLKKHRDSNERVWRRFAKEIGAKVIEDYSVKPIHLHDRFALYAGADMNFGVTNGPVACLFYTPYPVQMWDCDRDLHAMSKHGMNPPGNHQLALPGQSLVWQEPTFDRLMTEFKRAGF